jgi:uncharacterized protein (DUF305 family)
VDEGDRVVRNRWWLVLVPVLGVVGLLTACGDSDEGHEGMPQMGDERGRNEIEVEESADHNAADVEFVQGMIPHHEQAVMMADMAEGRAESDEVKDLAERIKGAQDPEIEQMRRWLQEWDQPEASDGHGMASGMMSDRHMADMRRMSGADFDEMFLEAMIEHHRGAIEMAQAVLDDGEHEGVAELARAVIEAQEAEITEMRELLAGR